MKTAQLHIRHTARPVAAIALLCALATLIGCASRKVEPSGPIASPYTQAPSVIIAVAPLINESGTSIVDPLQLSDSIANTVQGIEGVSAIPVNRTIAAMRALEMRSVLDPDESVRLARTLGADGIIVGTVMAWQPYDPPQIGLSLALFAASDKLWGFASSELDPRALTAAPSDYGLPPSWVNSRPTSAISELVDAEDPRVVRAIERYAVDRNDPPHALGHRKYTANMKLYAKFVSHELVSKLMDQESFRLTGVAQAGGETNERP